jgi:hypothetical protein
LTFLGITCFSNLLWLWSFVTTYFVTALTPYLSALDFCYSLVLNIEFDELDFWSISNWNFAGSTGSKNQVQTGQENLDHQTR